MKQASTDAEKATISTKITALTAKLSKAKERLAGLTKKYDAKKLALLEKKKKEAERVAEEARKEAEADKKE